MTSSNTHDPAAPDPSPNANQCRFTKAAGTGRWCAWELGSDTERTRVLVKRSQQRGDDPARETVMHSQDTLVPSDLTTPWRGSAVIKQHEAKRPICSARTSFTQ